MANLLKKVGRAAKAWSTGGFSELFGGGLGGLKDTVMGTDSSVDYRQMSTMTPEQNALLRKILGDVGQNRELVNQARGQVDPFTGELAPGMSRLENLSLAALEQEAMNQVGGGGEGNALLGEASGAARRAMAGDSVDMNEFNSMFQTGVQDPLVREFQDNVLPELTARFSGTSAYGSDRRVQEGRAVDRLGENLSSARANMLFQTQEAGKNRALQAASLAPGLASSKTDTLTKLLAAGGVPRQAQDTLLSRQYNEFIRQQEGKKRQMDMALALLGLKPLENIATVTPGKEGILGPLAQGAGAGFAMMLASDRRLKSNIKRVGTHKKGFGVYTYDLFGQPEAGVMADEVEQIMPEAVKTVCGIKMVNYAMLLK